MGFFYPSAKKKHQLLPDPDGRPVCSNWKPFNCEASWPAGNSKKSFYKYLTKELQVHFMEL